MNAKLEERYRKQDNVASHPHTTLFELEFNVKFPVLRLLQFLSDFKSTVLMPLNCLVLRRNSQPR